MDCKDRTGSSRVWNFNTEGKDSDEFPQNTQNTRNTQNRNPGQDEQDGPDEFGKIKGNKAFNGG